MRYALTLRKGLLATGSLGEKLLALGDGLATEADTLLGIEDGTLPDEGLDTASTAIDLVKSDLVDDLGTVLPGNAMSVLVNSIARGFRGQLTCGEP